MRRKIAQRNHRHSLSEKKGVIKLYHLGFTYQEISQQTGISKGYVGVLLRTYMSNGISGLKIKPCRKYSQVYKLSILHAIERKAVTLEGASIEYGVGSTSLYNWLHQYRQVGESGFLRLGREPDKEKPPKLLPMRKQQSTSGPPVSARERELELELAKARAEIDYLKKLEALILAKEKQEKKRKPRSSKN